MKQFLIAVCWGICLCPGLISCNNSRITLETLLTEMGDREAMTRFPDPGYSLKQVSSHNPASVRKDSAGWFANFDMSHFQGVEEINGRREFILFDEDGPGAIVRWWMTFYKAQYGTLRVYIDGNSSPVIEGTPAGVLSGDILAGYPFSASVQEGAPLGEEGRDYDHNLYLPIPYARHLKITYENDILVKRYENEGIQVPGGYWWPDVFYNICYREYAPGTVVESFSMEGLRKAKPVLDACAGSLLNKPLFPSGSKEFERLVPGGDSLVLEFSDSNSSIRGLTLQLDAGNMNQALRSTVLSVTFDGNRTIWVPLGEFFGIGYVMAPHDAWMCRVSGDGQMESFWVMPFRESCRMVMINYGEQDIGLKGSVITEPYTWDNNSLYFHALWHEYHFINSRDENGAPFDLNIIGVKGKGLYAGDQVTLFNNTYHWWGEGDEKIFVDGESFPSSFGTGTEDYYGYSFGRPEPFSHPFLSQPVGEGNNSWGVTVNFRHRSLDAIPFTTSLLADIELWHWADVRMNYALTAFWYGGSENDVNVAPDINAVRNKVVMNREDIGQP